MTRLSRPRTGVFAAAVGAALGVALVVPAAPLRAQLPGVGLGASLGANLPAQKYDEGAKPGVVGTLFAELRLGAPVSLRGSLLWSRSDIDNPLIRPVNADNLPAVRAGDVSGDVNLLGASADLAFDLGRSMLRPYVVGGVGMYRRRVAQDIRGATEEYRTLRRTDTDVGYNGGLGLKLALGVASVFAEARYYSVRTTPDRTNFVPVMVGLSF
jgi:hypothetical protein